MPNEKPVVGYKCGHCFAYWNAVLSDMPYCPQCENRGVSFGMPWRNSQLVHSPLYQGRIAHGVVWLAAEKEKDHAQDP